MYLSCVVVCYILSGSLGVGSKRGSILSYSTTSLEQQVLQSAK